MRTRTHIWFAIAVRNAEDLWLYREIKRSWKSDVYVFWPPYDNNDLRVSKGVRAYDKPCWRARSGAEYTEVVEIQADEISQVRETSLQKYCPSLAIDFTAPDAPPSLPKIIQQAVFTDAAPYIHVTLWDLTVMIKQALPRKGQ